MSHKIVIIGNGPAGMSAAGAARLANRSAEITVIDTKDYDTFHPCAMPFVIGGYLKSVDDIIENLNYERSKINLISSSVVEQINFETKVITIVNKKTNEKQSIEYTSLVFCTGSNVFIPPIKGRDLDNVFSLKFAEDAKAIKDAVMKTGVAKVAIVGGSAIGIEVASEIAHLNKEVTIIEMQPQLMPFKISSSFAKIVKEKLTALGISVKTDMMVKEIIGDSKVEKICFRKGDNTETIDVDVVVLATGVRSNTTLAKESGLEIDEKLKAIKVNERLETSVEGVYAAGDCVTVKNLITNENTLAMLAGPAVRQGRVAGINAAGGQAMYPGSVNSFIVSSRDFYVGLAGINEEQAKDMGMEVTTAKLSAPIRPHYMPTSKEITIKLIAKSDDGKLLGGEVIGEEKVDVNVNYIVMALQSNLTVYDLLDIDFCYAPAVSETIYPIIKVADAVMRKIERKKAKAAKK